MARPFNPKTYGGWRKLVLSRDENKCVQCGATSELQVDHIQPQSKHPELKYEVSNGRTLCFACHKKTTTYGGKMLLGRKVCGNPYGTV